MMTECQFLVNYPIDIQSHNLHKALEYQDVVV